MTYALTLPTPSSLGTIYAYMQAAGMVMDHTTDCDRYHALRG